MRIPAVMRILSVNRILPYTCLYLCACAAEGALFSNVFVSNSLCSPARATLLTAKILQKEAAKP
jgi:hypothetical protein